MALAFLFELPGTTQEQYDQVIEKLQLGGRTYPGQLFHVAGPMEGGWRVVDVWESQEAADKFLQAKLGQAFQEVGIAPTQPKVWPVHNILRP
jgi:quinol monooxygenase YgiN